MKIFSEDERVVSKLCKGWIQSVCSQRRMLKSVIHRTASLEDRPAEDVTRPFTLPFVCDVESALPFSIIVDRAVTVSIE